MLGLVSCSPSCLSYMRSSTCFIELAILCMSNSVWKLIIAWCKNLTALDLRIYSYHQNSQTSNHRCGARCIVQLCNVLISDPLDPWMCLCRFMIHRVIDWCVAKTTNSTIAYFVFSQNLLASSEFSNKQTSLRILMYSTTIQHPNYYLVGLWMYLCRFMIHRVIDWCAAKTTNSTITYFIFPQNHLRVKRIGSSRIIRKIKQGNIFTIPGEQHNHATPFLNTRWEHEYKCDNPCFAEWLIGVSQKQQILPIVILSS